MSTAGDKRRVKTDSEAHAASTLLRGALERSLRRRIGERGGASDNLDQRCEPSIPAEPRLSSWSAWESRGVQKREKRFLFSFCLSRSLFPEPRVVERAGRRRCKHGQRKTSRAHLQCLQLKTRWVLSLPARLLSVNGDDKQLMCTLNVGVQWSQSLWTS